LQGYDNPGKIYPYGYLIIVFSPSKGGKNEGFVFCRMSSHHFVREGQEPALLILQTIPWQTVAPLLEWAPLVVVAGAVVENVLHWGIKVDAVITPADQVPAVEEMLAGYGPVKILSHPADTDPLVASLDYITHSQQSAVNITSTDPAALAATIAKHTHNLNIALITPTHHWSLFRSGPYKKWLPAHTTIHVHDPSTTQAITTSTDGLITLTPPTPFWITETL
jgi:hypothetical protein